MSHFRVTNAVMALRKWVKRIGDRQKTTLWGSGFETVRVYKCLICDMEKEGYFNIADHLLMRHRKKLDNDCYKALRRMKESQDDKCVGEGASEQTTGVSPWSAA